MKFSLECFAGCNTANGFFSGFEGVFMNTQRTFFIKGAPGTGKSSLMKRIAARQKALGHTVHIFHCSSDPDSLDAVHDETISAAILDATSPHAYDPPLPGATGSLLSLGDCLDEAELSKNAREIEKINADIRREFEEASGFLRAADSLVHKRLTPSERHEAERLAAQIYPEISPAKSPGRSKSYFLSAVTPKGKTGFESPFPPSITVSVNSPGAPLAGEVLRLVLEKCRLNGRSSILFLNPVNPAIIDHMYLPQDGLFLTSDAAKDAKASFAPACRTYAPAAEIMQITRMLYEKAARSMLSAKVLHDELEKYYIPRMDFSKLVEAESRVIEAFDRCRATHGRNA